MEWIHSAWEWLVSDWEHVAIALLVADKIAEATPFKQDDNLIKMIKDIIRAITTRKSGA